MPKNMLPGMQKGLLACGGGVMCDAGRYDKGWNGLRAEMFGEEV